jgi:hypothetical protein
MQFSTTTRCAVFNLINPTTTSWSSLVPVVQRFYPHIDVIDLKTWVDDLVQINNSKPCVSEIETKPALKLLDFYRGLIMNNNFSPQIELQQAKSASITMRNMSPVDESLLENWLRQWSF